MLDDDMILNFGVRADEKWVQKRDGTNKLGGLVENVCKICEAKFCTTKSRKCRVKRNKKIQNAEKAT